MLRTLYILIISCCLEFKLNFSTASEVFMRIMEQSGRASICTHALAASAKAEWNLKACTYIHNSLKTGPMHCAHAQRLQSAPTSGSQFTHWKHGKKKLHCTQSEHVSIFSRAGMQLLTDMLCSNFVKSASFDMLTFAVYNSQCKPQELVMLLGPASASTTYT